MNRKLMAVAVAGVFAAPVGVLAQSSTVQIYGKITYEYGYADGGSGRPKTDIAGTPGGSAIGFRGQEKLGGGLTAWFQCESSADVRGDSQDGFCSRNSAIGFKGNWGNLHFGRWDSPFKRAINMGTVGSQDTGLLGHSFLLAGHSTGMVSYASVGQSRDVWKRRDAAWTYYESPNFGGFQILAGFTPGNRATAQTNATTSAKPRVLSLGGTFKKGPIAVGLGYEEHQEFGNVGGKNDDKAWNISASYTFANKLEVGVAYLDSKYETSTTTETKKKNWQIGVDWAIAGPHGLEAAYTEAGDSKGNGGAVGSTIAAAGPETGAKQFSIKYRYAFSKRTTARLGYVKLKNDTNAFYELGNTLQPTGNGQDQDAIVLYLEHGF